MLQLLGGEKDWRMAKTDLGRLLKRLLSFGGKWLWRGSVCQGCRSHEEWLDLWIIFKVEPKCFADNFNKECQGEKKIQGDTKVFFFFFWSWVTIKAKLALTEMRTTTRRMDLLGPAGMQFWTYCRGCLLEIQRKMSCRQSDTGNWSFHHQSFAKIPSSIYRLPVCPLVVSLMPSCSYLP